MLTETEKQEIDHELSHYPLRRSASIDALKIVQKHRGWVSDESLRDLAAYLEMTPDELDSIATFYNLIFRKPVGKHIILICDSVSCWIMGYEKLLDHLQNRLGIALGETSDDGLFTLLPVPCLGNCDHAPSMMIDDELYNNLNAKKIDEILDRYLSAK
jgi:NADH-quinone oxidoreductase subunit E